MKPLATLAFAPLAALALAGCEQISSLTGGAEEDGEPARVELAEVASDAAVAQDADAEAQMSEDVTPMAERTATIGLLNKRNNVTKDIQLKPGESVEEGPVIVRLEACERTAPYEFPQETGAFVQLDVLERGAQGHARVFSGWLFKENPSLNVVEHPIYDVWVKDCAMRFPGEPAIEAAVEPASETASEASSEE